jgi:molybdopterin converting factor subunit 1
MAYDRRDMRVRVLYFGVLKDLLQASEEVVEVQVGATVAELLSLSELRASNSRKPESRVWSALAVAVNREYAGPGTVLREGDEVAFLPPVSGG